MTVQYLLNQLRSIKNKDIIICIGLINKGVVINKYYTVII